ncbi:MAG: sugar transferase, partial [Candidatus Omnitrophica bacterium]|nr:sugar transferase [Candidatus Omnitrophota bacterium]
GLRVIGFLDDFKKDDDLDGKKILGKISEFRLVAQKNFIEKLFITVHHDSNVFLTLLEEARDAGIAVRVIPQGFDLTTGDFFRYNIGFIPVLEYSDVNRARKQVGKRFFDFTISLISFIIFLPVFALIAILICLDSKGFPFYLSKRYGKHGKVFTMYKFRSMSKGADQSIEKLRNQNEVDGPIFKMRKDPRITRMG